MGAGICNHLSFLFSTQEWYLDAAARGDGESVNAAVVKIMQRVDLTLNDDAGI